MRTRSRHPAVAVFYFQIGVDKQTYMCIMVHMINKQNEYKADGQMKTRYVILDFIVWYKEKYDGNSPSVREMMEAGELKSTSSVNKHVASLIKEGKLYTHPDIPEGASRCLMVTGGKWAQGNELNK